MTRPADENSNPHSLAPQSESSLTRKGQNETDKGQLDTDGNPLLETPLFVAQESASGTGASPGQKEDRISHFLIEKLLGKGMFGKVFRAFDEKLGRRVAIKVPHSELIERSGFLELYRKEAMIIARMDHPRIVQVYEIGSTVDYPFFLVSRFIEGVDLRSRMQQGRLAFAPIAQMIESIAEGLEHAHARGLVHRDLKPDNILIDTAGQPCILDFGVALQEEDYGKGPARTGTPLYNSPEQARNEGHKVDERSDLFSLGVILYELLTGELPFMGKTWEELLEKILHHDPKSPLAIEAAIPPELNRICLKCLSKPVKERYQHASELAEDLKHYLAEVKSAANLPRLNPLPIQEQDTHPSTLLKTAVADLEQVRIVPKGLRSFDEGDSSFFLDLLPGARDREGLPDSIRFWKNRIEKSEDTFAVGLIYGPSGCGKSSLLRAGLLPRLDENKVKTVFVEAAAGQTEPRLLTGLRGACGSLGLDASLKEVALAIRKGRAGVSGGKKVLIVIDQFEQWLHEKQGEYHGGFKEALGQCDGVHLQCLLLVRDDFWLATSRFMKALEIDLLPDGNIRLADLFDQDHAKKVLRALGRAYGRLPDFPKEASPVQTQFLRSAVEQLSQENRVISVRLALFAEMMKSREWTPESLREVGGVEGLAITFLEETFNGATASPEYRYHQIAVRGVFNALLPEVGSDIKGQMRSTQELQQGSGYEGRDKDFAVLMRILDNELRIITPTEEGNPQTEDRSNPQAGKFYQLAHDYLVPGIRDWLRRKQKETAQGRAEILLEERTALWKDKKQTRQLPSLFEYLRISWNTKPFQRNQTQKEMMGRAGSFHGFRVGALIILTVFLGLITREAYGRLESRRLRDRLLESTTTDISGILKELVPYRGWVNPLLQVARAQAESEKDPRKVLRASLGLLPTDRSQVDYLYGQLLQAEPQEFVVIREQLSRHREELSPSLWSILEDAKATTDQRFHAACALAEYSPEDSRWGKISIEAASMLAMQKPFVIGAWTDVLQGVAAHLLAPLGQILVEENRSLAERGLIATVYGKLAKGGVDGYSRLEKPLEEKGPANATKDTKIAMAKEQASLGLALLAMGKGEKVWPFFRHSPDPTNRSLLIDRMSPWGIEARTLFAKLEMETDDSIRRAILLSLGEYGLDRLSISERQNQIPRLLDSYRDDPDPGVHSATEWLLRQWKAQEAIDSVDKVLATGKVEGKRQWYLNRQRQTMVIVPETQPFLMGEGDECQKVKINRTFAIAAKEVTVEEFLRFRKEQKYDKPFAATKDCPINMATWYDTAAFCNWLSEEEGITKEQWCYLPNSAGKYAGGMQLAPNYLQRSGYRLPTEAEWEYACRAGSTTQFSFGDTPGLLGKHGWFSDNSLQRSHPVANLKPNDFGLFDMHGNVMEWCIDVFEPYQVKGYDLTLINDIEKKVTIDPKNNRVVRGGAFSTQASYGKSANRFNLTPPFNLTNFVGFRLARTIIP